MDDIDEIVNEFNEDTTTEVEEDYADSLSGDDDDDQDEGGDGDGDWEQDSYEEVE